MAPSQYSEPASQAYEPIPTIHAAFGVAAATSRFGAQPTARDTGSNRHVPPSRCRTFVTAVPCW
ncbi:hypothetical protein ACFQHO_28225 [Actinomadura yumaensis]|uniref:hypothetical protein n=1 Tax=Actinomadura yumaensis TaxID=111807 RepID=UPI003608A706